MQRKVAAAVLVMAFGSPVLTYSQNSPPCDQVKAELAKIKEENAYLRNSLKINEPVKQINEDNIDFKLLNVQGSSKSQNSGIYSSPENPRRELAYYAAGTINH